MQPFLPIGPLVIPSKPLLYVLGFWLALLLLERVGDRRGVDGARLSAAATNGLLIAIVSARLAFVLTHWSAFANNLLSIVWPLTSGFVPLVGGVAWVLAFAWQLRSFNLAMLDLLTPSLLALLVCIVLADLFGGPGFGVAATRLPGGQHPVQLYEALAIAPALWAWRSAERANARPGAPFLLALAAAAFWLMLVTPWRGSAGTVDGWYGRQLLGLLVALVAVAVVAYRELKAAAVPR